MGLVETDTMRLMYVNAFGQSVTFNGTTTITAVFYGPYLEVDENGYAVASSKPSLWCRTVDVTSVTKGSTVVVNGTTYTVHTMEADATGMSAISLHL